MRPDGQSDAVLAELDRILSCTNFSRNDRLSRFLRFVVERHLEGRDSELKESVIATQVFGRPADYDPKLDAIVRTEAIRLRARLEKYYSSEGSGNPLVIELPKGGYVPRFTPRNGHPQEPKTKSRSRPWALAAGLAALGIAIAAGVWWWVHRQTAPIAIAVLPLENLSRDPSQDYLADGLTDELIHNLSVIEGLAVRSRTSSFALKGAPRNMREMGNQLGADYILEGSVLRGGDQLRINIQFVRVRDDSPLWSGKFDRDFKDVLAIQEDIALAIVNELRLKLGRGRRRYETSTAAYDLYLRARARASQRRPLNEAIEAFEQVIARDPKFAPAHAGLASLHARQSSSFPPPLSSDQLLKMKAAAEKALELDPLLAEAHEGFGLAAARESKWEQAEKSFLRAIELEPNRSSTYLSYYASVLRVFGRHEEGIRYLSVAERADPLSPTVTIHMIHALTSAGRYAEAEKRDPKIPEGFDFKRSGLARIRLGQGRPAEAIEILKDDPSLTWNPLARGILGNAYARAGRREDAEKMAAASEFANEDALIFAGLGDKERTLEALDRMTERGPERVGAFMHDPAFAFLRGDPRLKPIRAKVGLPE